MATTGKNGSDTVAKLLRHIIKEYAKFGPKLIQTAQIMQTGGLLTAAEYAAIVGFFNVVNEALSALAKVAEYSGFDPRV